MARQTLSCLLLLMSLAGSARSEFRSADVTAMTTPTLSAPATTLIDQTLHQTTRRPEAGQAGSSASQTSYRGHLPGPFQAEVLRVIDGDTIEVRVALWLDQELVTKVRLRDIDAPELIGACPSERELAQAARDVLDELVSARHVRLIDISRDKFGGRIVGRVLADSGEDVATTLLETGLVRPYGGKRRQGWCDIGAMAQR